MVIQDCILNFCQNLLQVALEDPKRFRIEMTFSRGADLPPLEVMQLRTLQMAWENQSSFFFWAMQEAKRWYTWFMIPCPFSVFLQMNDSEAALLHQEHTLPIMGPERLQEVGSYLTLEKMERMIRPFAMPAEDFPPPSTPQGFSGYFSKSASVLERLVNLWPFHKYGNTNGGKR